MEKGRQTLSSEAPSFLPRQFAFTAEHPPTQHFPYEHTGWESVRPTTINDPGDFPMSHRKEMGGESKLIASQKCRIILTSPLPSTGLIPVFIDLGTETMPADY